MRPMQVITDRGFQKILAIFFAFPELSNVFNMFKKLISFWTMLLSFLLLTNRKGDWNQTCLPFTCFSALSKRMVQVARRFLTCSSDWFTTLSGHVLIGQKWSVRLQLYNAVVFLCTKPTCGLSDLSSSIGFCPGQLISTEHIYTTHQVWYSSHTR